MSRLNGKNKVTAINTWMVAVFTYGLVIFNLNESELKTVTRNTRKTLSMYRACSPNGDVDRLYIKRKDGGRGMSSLEHVVRGKENGLYHYVFLLSRNSN